MYVRMYLTHCVGAVATQGGFFGEGFGPIHTSGLQCTGEEEALTDCSSGEVNACSHANDAGVVCTGTYIVYDMHMHAHKH